MSRIIIKNVPKHITEPRLKKIFEAKGTVTDVKIMKTKDGRSRNFAFLGYDSEESAQAAIKHFDHTFVDTSRVSVTLARPPGDAELPRPWSRYSKGSSAFMKKEKTQDAETTANHKKRKKPEPSKPTSAVAELESDRDLQEFLHIMKPRSTKALWENDEGPNKPRKQKVEKTVVASKRIGERDTLVERTHITFDDSDDNEDDDALYEDMPAMKGVRERIDSDDDSRAEEESAQTQGESKKRKREKGKKKKKKKSSSSEEDTASLAKRSRTQDGGETEEAVHADKSDGRRKNKRKHTKQTDSASESDAEEDVGESGRLFIRNMPYQATEDDLQAYYSRFGPLTEVHIPIDKLSKKPTGMAYVVFMLPENAVRAYEETDNKIFMGRLLQVLPSRIRKHAHSDTGAGQSASFKQRRAGQQRAAARAGADVVAWNSLFVNANTAMNSLASQHQIKKSDILNPESDNMAVRMALTEAHIIQQTKRELSEAQIDMDVLTSPVKSRSKTVILVKNIPFDTTADELRALFGPHGDVARIVFPPSKTVAVVEYLHPTEARKAFCVIAYRSFKHVPLYLEWAPEGIFKTPPPPPTESEPRDAHVASRAEDAGPSAGAGPSADADAPPTASLYVKNLNFATTEDTLKKVFSGVVQVRAVTIAKKRDMSSADASARKSMGFGFIEFATYDDAMTALKKLQNVEVDGHHLQLKFTQRKSSVAAQSGASAPHSATAVAEGQSRTKVVIRNVPFEATKKDLVELFRPFAQIKSVRVPKKRDGSHRGFAFVEFVTHAEALAAFNALASVHLLGRHLAMEWAAAELSVEAARQKTADQFKRSQIELPTAKRTRLASVLDDATEEAFEKKLGLSSTKTKTKTSKTGR